MAVSRDYRAVLRIHSERVGEIFRTNSPGNRLHGIYEEATRKAGASFTGVTMGKDTSGRNPPQILQHSYVLWIDGKNSMPPYFNAVADRREETVQIDVGRFPNKAFARTMAKSFSGKLTYPGEKIECRLIPPEDEGSEQFITYRFGASPTSAASPSRSSRARRGSGR